MTTNLSSPLLSSRRSLVARVALMAVMGTLVSCQSGTLQSSNIANETCNGQPCAVPVSDATAIANGKFFLDDTKLAGIRAALADFNPEIRIHVNRNGPEEACLPNAHEGCLTAHFLGGVSIDPALVQLPVADQSAVLPPAINIFPFPLVQGQNPVTVAGTPFEILGQLSGLDRYEVDLVLNTGPTAASVQSVFNNDPNGLYFRGEGQFPQGNHVGGFLCDCVNPSPIDTGGITALADACASVCSTVIAHPAFPDSSCQGVSVQTKLNRFKFQMGFAPQLPSTHKGNWTKELAGKNFHLPEMFDADLRFRVFLKVAVADFDDVHSDTMSDLVFGVRFFGCTGFTCGTGTCDAVVTDVLSITLEHFIDQPLSLDLAQQFEKLFDYDEISLPPKCSVNPNPLLPTCTEAMLTDWTAASFTYQKWSWLAGAFGPYPNGGWLPIKNIEHVDLPLQVPGLEFTFDNDIDGDGILTPDDWCPTTKDDSSLFDLDGDGMGDLCDPCPFDATNDADGDGVCENADTCPGVFDNFQTNCNALSEHAHGATLLGDACDPVPCPSQSVDPTFVITSKVKCPNPCQFGNCPAGCPIGSYEGTVTLNCGSERRNQIDVHPLASHPLPTIVGGSPIPVPDVLTPARFCHMQPGIFCDDLQVDIQDDQLAVSDCAPPAPVGCVNVEMAEDHFHRVTFAAGQLNGTNPNGMGPGILYDVAAKNLLSQPATLMLTWNYQSDYLRWSTDKLFQVDPGAPNGLRGNFWLHADTPVGDIIDIGTGLHGVEGQNPTLDDELANSHNLGIDGKGLVPEGPTVCISSTITKLPILAPIGNPPPPGGGNGKNNAANADYADEFSTYIIWRPTLQPPTNAFRRFDAELNEADYVLPVNDGLFGALTGAPNEDAQVINDRLGAVLKTRLVDPDLVWVNAAEPFSYQGTPQSFPAAVALSRVGGEELIDTVHTDGRFLLANQDRAVDPPDPRDGSPHAIDYAAVLTRMHRGIFVLGGRDVQTDVETHEIWFNPLDSTHWNVVPSDIKVEKVLAATYDFHSDELVVLDETPAGLARLWALKLRSYDSRILGTWPRHQAWNRHWLVVDRDGDILLASSNVTAKRHAISRLDIGNTEMQVDGITEGNRAFVLPPLVDARGYTLLLRQSQGNGKVNRERYVNLPLSSASVSDVGDQL